MAELPLLLGYQRMHVGLSNSDVLSGQRALERFARREGLRLLRVYIDKDANRPCRGLVRLIGALRETGAGLVAVPTRQDLGGSAFVQSTTVAMIERETRAQVLVLAEVAGDAYASSWVVADREARTEGEAHGTEPARQLDRAPAGIATAGRVSGRG